MVFANSIINIGYQIFFVSAIQFSSSVILPSKKAAYKFAFKIFVLSFILNPNNYVDKAIFYLRSSVVNIKN